VSTTSLCSSPTDVMDRFRATRGRTRALCAPLTAEDMMVQSLAEASPAKWHLAHTAWFFETFILREFLPGYVVFNADFSWLFNSYYQGLVKFPEKRLRSSFSRPGLDEVLRYREHVGEAVERLMERNPEPEAVRRVELGVNHEEQHQELLLTDILHAFFTNPLRPTYLDERTEAEITENGNPRSRKRDSSTSSGQALGHPAPGHPRSNSVAGLGFEEFAGGLKEVGHGAEESGEGFSFDLEQPRHQVWLEPFALGRRLVTCAEYAEFMADGGYRRAELWLSAGWSTVQNNGWRAPLYWTSESGDWSVFTLRGELPLAKVENAPVSQVSYFEADAYARWAGRRLATEFEWETAAAGRPVTGNLLDSGRLLPAAVGEGGGGTQLFGDCWEWTASAFLGYPGFRALEGTLGEYNGKFMSGQMVLRGGSCVTPAAHIRASYRNFFAPETRWQFSGIRLAS
jgi:ergothioneine biosynthesis protein EgtB